MLTHQRNSLHDYATKQEVKDIVEEGIEDLASIFNVAFKKNQEQIFALDKRLTVVESDIQELKCRMEKMELRMEKFETKLDFIIELLTKK